jgi:hypothetical protein
MRAFLLAATALSAALAPHEDLVRRYAHAMILQLFSSQHLQADT